MSGSAAELLVAARRGALLTQHEVAARAGVPQSMLSAYESGRREPTLPTLRRLVAATGGTLSVEVVPARPPYRPMTVRALAEEVAAAPEPERWVLLAEFLTEYGFEERGTRPALLAKRPRPSGSRTWDALLGALAEHLAGHDGVPAPAWTEEADRFLDRFWFPTDTPAARADAMVSAPAAFVRRGVFIERDSLVRA